MKIFLIILGVLAAIILLLVILLHFSVKAYIEADKKHAKVLVKYLGFKLFETEIPDKEKDEKPPDEHHEPEIELSEVEVVDSTDDVEKAEIEKKIAEAAEKPPADEPKEDDKKDEESSDGEKKPTEPEEEKTPKASLTDQFNEFKKYIPAGKKAFRKLLKLIRFYDLRVELTVGNDDPCKAGKNFGNINAIFYSVLALLCCLFTVKIDHTEINCDFENKRTDFYLKTAVFVRPSAVVALAAYIGVYYLKIRKSMKKLEKMAKEKES